MNEEVQAAAAEAQEAVVAPGTETTPTEPTEPAQESVQGSFSESGAADEGAAGTGDESGDEGNAANAGGAGEDDGQEEISRAASERAAEIARAREEARVEAIIDALGGINPFNHKPMKDAADVRVYEVMREIERTGGDPIHDFADAMAKKERESTEQTRAKDEKEAWFASDRADFARKHPDVDLGALIHDPDFAAYAEGKVGKVPIAEIYEGYQGFLGRQAKRAEQDANKKAAQAAAARAASPGALSGEGGAEKHFTREQVRKMTQAEVSANYDAIVRDMKHWK